MTRFDTQPQIQKLPVRATTDLTGNIYGKLKVLGFYGVVSRHYKWVCLCECGRYSCPYGFQLVAGKSKSCGCVAAEKSKRLWELGGDDAKRLREYRSINSKNASHRQSKSPLYRVWTDMRRRCLNEKSKWYNAYGGRGITISSDWDKFENFLRDMEKGYSKGLSLGRVDNNKCYSKENCRWETASQQQRNKTNTTFLDVGGRILSLQDAAEEYGLSAGCIRYRLSAGWSIDKALNTKSERA